MTCNPVPLLRIGLLAFVALFAASLNAALPGQPFASYWHPNTLLSWSPATDPDAAFNRASVPLAPRIMNPALNVNPHARTNEGRVTSLVAFASTSGNPSQGGLTMPYYSGQHWPYVHELVFWGGSAGEGLILAPNATVIDAAHRNGVVVYGNVFFPPTVYGGQMQWVNDFLQKSGTRFPVADKMIEVAQHYGFDGWFINQETAGGNSTTATTMRDFIKYLRTNSTLRVMWYDAMTESGSISWQDSLTTANDMFFHDNGVVSDDMFIDFGWSSTGLANSRTRAQSFGRSQFDLYAGIDVEGSGYNASVNWSALFPEGQPHVLSLGLYRPEWTRNGSSSVADYYVRDSRFWIGWNNDPSNTATTNTWKGIAHYIPARSPVTKIPFVTTFNTGHGNRYAINGQILRTGEWNNLSLQDVLPTWRWLMRSTGEKLSAEFDFTDAWNGGNCVRVFGNLTATNDLNLYQASLPVTNTTSLRLAFKTGTSGTATRMKLALAFEDSTTVQYFDVPNTTNSGWNIHSFDLSSFSGRKLAVIGLRFGSSSAGNGYSMRIGQIAVLNGSPLPPIGPSNVVVEQTSAVDASNVTVRLKWNHSPSPVYTYNVYRRNANNTRTWLGGTPNNAYFVPELRRAGSETSATVEVEAVGTDFGTSTAAVARVFWPSAIVSAGSVWKYNDTGADLGAMWRSNSFNDSSWPSGPAMLGYSDANGVNPRTTNSFGADPNNKHITTYYRRAFQVADRSAYSSLGLSLQRDDGAVVYLNGTEVFRSNMPNGAVGYRTLASGSVSGGDETAFYSTSVDPALLLNGTNLLAVEIHQNTNNSSDIAFDLSLAGMLSGMPSIAITLPVNGTVLQTNYAAITASATDSGGSITNVEFYADNTLLGRRTNSPYSITWTNIPVGLHYVWARATDDAGQRSTSSVVSVTRPGSGVTGTTLIPDSAVWRYFDLNSDPGTSWREIGFTDAGWKSGAAELGFGDAADGRPETTVISNNLQWTTYFRRSFVAPEPTLVTSLEARMVRDDGAVVYLNGVEVWRDNMPTGVITASTPAATTINGDPEAAWITNALSRAALVKGTNVLAVEIHQQSTTSSDLSFDFGLRASIIIPPRPPLVISRGETSIGIVWPADSGDFGIYSTTNLVEPTWARMTNTPTMSNGSWSLQLPVSTNGNAFYQLRTE